MMSIADEEKKCIETLAALYENGQTSTTANQLFGDRLLEGGQEFAVIQRLESSSVIRATYHLGQQLPYFIEILPHILEVRDRLGRAEEELGGEDGNESGSRSAPTITHVVLLVHGIRDRAGWQSMVAGALSTSTTTIRGVKYGYFDVFRFLSPWDTSRKPMQRLERALRDAKEAYPDARLSVVAHSFGTYLLTKILGQHTDLKIWKIILCGSVVKQSFDWSKIKSQVGDENIKDKAGYIVNECGSEDVWPVLGRAAGWGYGDAGTNGFGHFHVTDRFHNGGHGLYFDDDFVGDFWKPFLVGDEPIAPGQGRQGADVPWWIWLLGFLPLRLVPPAIVVTLLILAVVAVKSAIGDHEGDSPPTTAQVTDDKGGDPKRNETIEKADTPSSAPKADETDENDDPIPNPDLQNEFRRQISSVVSKKAFDGSESTREDKTNAVGITNVKGSERSVKGTTGQSEISVSSDGANLVADVTLTYSGDYDAKNFIGVLAEYRTDPHAVKGTVTFRVTKKGDGHEVEGVSFSDQFPAGDHDASRMASEAVRADVIIRLSK